MHFNHGQDDLSCVEEQRFDVIVLDVVLPLLDGFSLLRQLRQKEYSTPVLVLTARDAMIDVMRGLDLGAHD